MKTLRERMESARRRHRTREEIETESAALEAGVELLQGETVYLESFCVLRFLLERLPVAPEVDVSGYRIRVWYTGEQLTRVHGKI